jgi:hypothetical protein
MRVLRQARESKRAETQEIAWTSSRVVPGLGGEHRMNGFYKYKEAKQKCRFINQYDVVEIIDYLRRTAADSRQNNLNKKEFVRTYFACDCIFRGR